MKTVVSKTKRTDMAMFDAVVT